MSDKVEDKALPIPQPLLDSGRTDDVWELARIWWGGERSQMIIRPVLVDQRMVGSVLAETAWHFARAYAERHNLDEEEVLTTIRQAFEDSHNRSADIRAQVRDAAAANAARDKQ